jgi:hypothetical protein
MQSKLKDRHLRIHQCRRDCNILSPKSKRGTPLDKLFDNFADSSTGCTLSSVRISDSDSSCHKGDIKQQTCFSELKRILMNFPMNLTIFVDLPLLRGLRLVQFGTNQCDRRSKESHFSLFEHLRGRSFGVL